jgi:hypothetical protein
MALEAAFFEGLGDGEACFGVERNGGGVVGFDAEDDAIVTGGAAGFEEGFEDCFAQSLSLGGGGDTDVGQFDLAGLEGVGVGCGKGRLSKLEQDAGAGEGQSQHLTGEPGQGLAQLGVDLVRVRGADGPGEYFSFRGDGAKANHGWVLLADFVVTLHNQQAQVREQGVHDGLVQGGEAVEGGGVELGEGDESHFKYKSPYLIP